jgi:urease accessory protein
MATAIDIPASQELRGLARMLAWMSPAFPVGAFAYSHGLEIVIAQGGIGDAETLFAWLSTLLKHGGAWTDAVLLAEAFSAAQARDAVRLEAATELARALAPSLERLRETEEQGRAFLAAVGVWTQAAGEPPPPVQAAPYPVAVGAATAGRLALDAVLVAYLHAFVSSLVAAAMRAVPLGQTAGVAVLARLEPIILATGRDAARSSLDELGGCAFLSDIASMRHETLHTRLFIS